MPEATKVLDTEIFPQDTISDLNLWPYICFVQSREAFTVKGNKHTHAHTRTHTHTHARTHIHTHACTHTQTQTHTHKRLREKSDALKVIILSLRIHKFQK